MISSNSFSKDNPTVSSNSFSTTDPTVSSNSFSKDELTRGGYAWEGENLTDSGGIGDMISGTAPGISEGSGIAHFKNRTAPPDITH